SRHGVATGARLRSRLPQFRSTRRGPARHPDRRPRFERRVLGRPRQTVFCGVHRSRAQAVPARAVSGIMSFKLPVSVLVVVHTADLEVLLIERATRPGFWQSVTGSLERGDEGVDAAAARELREETGIDGAGGSLRRWKLAYTFEIYPQWRHRFGPGVTYNTEHVLSLALPRRAPVTLAPGEHTD